MAIKHIKRLIEDGGIVFMTYVGFMSQTILSGMIEALEHEQKLTDIPSGKTHNILSVLIEMTQNIMKYSKEEFDEEMKLNSNGLVLVGKVDEENFYVHSQNIISSQDKERIEKRLNIIKNLDEEQVKQEFRKLRRNATNSHEKGAGIGFYDIAKRSKDLTFEFEELGNDKYNFYLTAHIK